MPIGPLRTGNEPFFYESWFNLVGNDSQHLVRRFPNERFAQNCVRKSIHSGGGYVMAWHLQRLFLVTIGFFEI